MSSKIILDELQKNEKNLNIGSEVLNSDVDKSEIRKGLPIKEIIKKMEKASKEHLFIVPRNVSTC